MKHLLTGSPWPGVLLWAGLHISDYYLTLTCARLYRQQNKFVFEGSFELNPVFQADVDALRWVSPRFMLACLASTGYVWLLWTVSLEAWGLSGPYLIGLGAMVLVELTIHTRHLRNLFLFKELLRDSLVRGRIEYPRPLSLRVSALEFAVFGALYGALLLLTGSLFLMGGALGCVLLSLRHYHLARKHKAYNT